MLTLSYPIAPVALGDLVNSDMLRNLKCVEPVILFKKKKILQKKT